MSTPEIRWRWVCPTWLSWAQAEAYTSLPRRILRELALQRLVIARSLYSRMRPTKINRDSIDELLCSAAAIREPIYWRAVECYNCSASFTPNHTVPFRGSA